VRPCGSAPRRDQAASRTAERRSGRLERGATERAESEALSGWRPGGWSAGRSDLRPSGQLAAFGQRATSRRLEASQGGEGGRHRRGGPSGAWGSGTNGQSDTTGAAASGAAAPGAVARAERRRERRTWRWSSGGPGARDEQCRGRDSGSGGPGGGRPGAGGRRQGLGAAPAALAALGSGEGESRRLAAGRERRCRLGAGGWERGGWEKPNLIPYWNVNPQP
jgi:hypothetical protein